MPSAASSVFDYTGLEPAPRQLAARSARAIATQLARSTKSVIDMGRRLIAVREQLDNRQWQAWLRSEFRWSRSVASNYMRVAEKFGDLNVVTRFQPSALYALARKYVSPKAIADAVALARSGQTVSQAIARRIIRRYGTPHSGLNPVAELRRRIAKISKQVDDLTKSTARPKLTELADELEALAGQLRRGYRRPSRPQLRLASKPAPRATASSRPARPSVLRGRTTPKRAAA